MSIAFRVSYTNLNTRRAGSMLVCSYAEEGAASTAKNSARTSILIDRVVEATPLDIFRSLSPAQRRALADVVAGLTDLYRIARGTRLSLERYGMISRDAVWTVTDLGEKVADIVVAKAAQARINAKIEVDPSLADVPAIADKLAELDRRING
jgi:hypothetical protein